MVTIAEPICTLTVEPLLKVQATSMYTAHATVMDMDTHAEDLNTTVTATCTSEIMDTVHQLHAETASTCTTMDTVVTVMTTAVDMVTWIVEAM